MPAEFPSRSDVAKSCAHSLTAAMLRDLDGNILFWNRAAEKNYGIPERKALGSVSHLLLDTVFPEPLSEINRQLLKSGKWTGELIHTLQDGQKVKVRSSWELATDQAATCVIETNSDFVDVRPQSAHLEKRRGVFEQGMRLLAEYKFWWLIPFIVVLLGAELIVELSSSNPIIPLQD